jgi:hypothetical protein
MKLFLLFTALIAFSSAQAEVSVRYYYIQPDAETYAPITQDNIRKAASYEGELRGPTAEYFLHLAGHAKRAGNFDPNFVRLLIESSDGNNVIFIDRFGVAKNKETEYQVNPRIFIRLESGLDMKHHAQGAVSFEDWLKISTLREEIPEKVREDQLDSPWLKFTYGLAAGALATILGMLISKRRKPATT